MVRLPMKRRTSLPLLLLSVVWMGNTETLQSKVQLQSLYFLEERELTLSKLFEHLSPSDKNAYIILAKRFNKTNGTSIIQSLGIFLYRK